MATSDVKFLSFYSFCAGSNPSIMHAFTFGTPAPKQTAVARKSGLDDVVPEKIGGGRPRILQTHGKTVAPGLTNLLELME